MVVVKGRKYVSTMTREIGRGKNDSRKKQKKKLTAVLSAKIGVIIWIYSSSHLPSLLLLILLRNHLPPLRIFAPCRNHKLNGFEASAD